MSCRRAASQGLPASWVWAGLVGCPGGTVRCPLHEGSWGGPSVPGVWSGQGGGSPPPGSGNGLWSGDMCSFDKCLLWQPHRTVRPAAGRGVWLWVTSEEVPGPLAEAATLQWSGCIGCYVACGQGPLPWDGAPFLPSLVFLCLCPLIPDRHLGSGVQGCSPSAGGHLHTEWEQWLGAHPC